MKRKYIIATIYLAAFTILAVFMKVSSIPKNNMAMKTVTTKTVKTKANKAVRAAKLKNSKYVSLNKNKPKTVKKEKKKAHLNLSKKEKSLIVKLAFAEAGNQDTKGKALVMLVVLNRVKDKRFPDTIHDVIYQKRQFSPVSSRKWSTFKPDKDCYKALELIDNGYDESKGALYFESKSKSTWHRDNLEFLFKHQAHYFYK